MNKLENIIYLYISIIVISALSIGIMYHLTDFNTLTESYSNIMLKDSSIGLELIAITVTGITLIAVLVQYFLKKDIQEKDYISKIIDIYV